MDDRQLRPPFPENRTFSSATNKDGMGPTAVDHLLGRPHVFFWGGLALKELARKPASGRQPRGSLSGEGLPRKAPPGLNEPFA